MLQIPRREFLPALQGREAANKGKALKISPTFSPFCPPSAENIAQDPVRQLEAVSRSSI